MKKTVLIVLLAAAIVGLSVFSTYIVRRDEIAARRQSVDQAWKHVNTAMEQRADLVPALLATLRTTASRNRAVADEAEHARADVESASTPADTIAANRRLDASVARLLVAAKDDTDLVFNQKFFVMQEKWAVTSNRIAPERAHYDRAVQDYNHFIADFPNHVFARWAHFAPLENYFAADANATSQGTADLMGI